MPLRRPVYPLLESRRESTFGRDQRRWDIHEARLDVDIHMQILIWFGTEQSVLVLARELQEGMLDLAGSQYHPVTCSYCQKLQRALRFEEENRVYLCLSDEMCRLVGCISSISGRDEVLNGILEVALP
jgi:hypothetical protein